MSFNSKSGSVDSGCPAAWLSSIGASLRTPNPTMDWLSNGTNRAVGLARYRTITPLGGEE